jgi:hypothetical protein
MTLSVNRNGHVIMRVPWRTPASEIQKFFAQKSAWVEKRLAEIKNRPKAAPKLFRHGEEFLYLGRSYPLLLQPGNHARDPLLFTGLGFLLNEGFAAHAREALIRWYKARARALIAERVDCLGGRLGLNPAGFRLMTAEFRWGSCGADNRLTFNWRLIMAPPEIIDYVIVHELLHISNRSHSKEFWQSLEAVIPDYQERRRWLEDYGHTLKL